jgi:serine phosphatase RsbU (regulator of sigma subunit)
VAADGESARLKEHLVIKHYPNTAALLIELVPEILRRWDQRVRREIPASRAQEQLVLQNNLGLLLGEVARALSPSSQFQAAVEELNLSEDHGGHRATLAEYSIGEMFLEYRLLRQTILEVLDEQRSLPPDEREVINDALERAMQEAVGGFAGVQKAAEHAAYERERRIAQVLQRPLLRSVAEGEVAGFALAACYEPAWDEADVGGDFLDVFTLPDGRAALVVGDASGKGVEAAAHNTQVKDLLRAFLREEPDQPGRALARVNNAVCDTVEALNPVDLEMFIVIAVLVLDPRVPEARYAAAGAEPLLLLRAGGEAQAIQCPALPLGVQRDTAYHQTTVRLAPGDAALLITDGITEARHDGQQLGYAGMVEIAQVSITALSLQEAAQSILAGARGFAQGRLSDDACLILARRR